ncbi:MAG: GNAT family N-acetyltransferase [Flavobacteriales bacterium]|nr:GNAT family N-acetyltransferase [Flavobacteriales bacterium]
MTLREATTADIPLIGSMARHIWPVVYPGIITPAQIAYMLELMYSDAALRDQLVHKGHRFLIADGEAGAALGFAGFEMGHSPQHARLHKLYVLPELKGTGVGHALLMGVLKAAAQAGDRTIELNVNKYNPAISFYTRHGFTVERDEVLDIGQGYVMDDHVMVRTIDPVQLGVA